MGSVARSFHHFLKGCLVSNGLQHKDLINWIESEQVGEPYSGASAIKEQLRQAAIKDLDAWRFPYVHEIARFFEHRGCRNTASRIRHICLQQSFDLGGIEDIFAPGDGELDQLWWLVFPPPIISAEVVSKWKTSCVNNFSLYRRTLSLYKTFRNSAIHTLARKHISIDLARFAISNGDHADAHLICRHVVRSWRESWRGTEPNLRSVSVRDAELYLRALLLIAIAKSFMFPLHAYDESYQHFCEAKAEVDACKAAGIITGDRAAELQSIISDRYLRMLTCLPFAGDDRHLEEMQLEAKRLSEQLGQVKEADKLREAPMRRSAAYDSLSRAHALMAMAPFLSSKSLLRKGEAADHLTCAKECQLEAKKLGFIEGLKGEKAVIGLIRQKTTEIILLCSEHVTGVQPQDEQRAGIDACFDELTKLFGPQDLRHTQTTLETLSMFVDRVFLQKGDFREGWLIGPASERLGQALTEEHRGKLERMSEQYKQLPFPPAPRPPRSQREPLPNDEESRIIERTERLEQRRALVQAHQLFKSLSPAREKRRWRHRRNRYSV